MNTGETINIRGAQSIDHSGYVVPNLDQAIEFFRDVLGAALLWRTAPVSSSNIDMRLMFNADPRASPTLAMMRLGPNLNVELVEYDIVGKTAHEPLASDVGVGHLAFSVDDIHVAGEDLSSRGVRMLQGPRRTDEGPNEGQWSWFCLTSWGMPLELIQRPPEMPYQHETDARLFVPQLGGTASI